MVFPAAPIQAPPSRQAVTGLIALSSVHPDVPDRWEGGVAFTPEPCGAGQLMPIGCADDMTKVVPTVPDGVTSYPAALQTGDRCTTLDMARDGEGIARRRMLADQSALLERLLWTGATDASPAEDGTDRQHLAADTVTELPTGGTAVPAGEALALMDQALTACLSGAQGMVHMTPYMLAVLVQADAVALDGGRYLTPNRHVVVAGSGYTGGGPRPAPGGALPAAPDLLASPAPNQWVYGTSAVTYLLGTVDVVTDVDHNVNNVLFVVERPGLALFGCCHYGVEVDLTPAA